MMKDTLLQLSTDVAPVSGNFSTLFIAAVNPRSFGHGDLYAHIAITQDFTVLATFVSFRIDVVADDASLNAVQLGSILWATGGLTGSNDRAGLIAGASFSIPLAPPGQVLTSATPAGVRIDGTIFSNIRLAYTLGGALATGKLSAHIGLKPSVMGRTYPVGSVSYAL